MLSSEEAAALSEEELAEEVKTIVSIASGSSMDSLSFLIYTMAIRQDVQAKVRQVRGDPWRRRKGLGWVGTERAALAAHSAHCSIRPRGCLPRLAEQFGN